ncbi:MAG TPA: hypothetical protein VGM05_04840 [Planctomycetaceae bacterium]|jgi:hypothetical protein
MPLAAALDAVIICTNRLTVNPPRAILDESSGTTSSSAIQCTIAAAIRREHENMLTLGLTRLAGFTKLKWLDLGGTHVTESGVSRLKRALPDLNVHW